MAPERLLTLWSVRIACSLYVIGIAARAIRRDESFREIWTLSFLFYLVHMAAAFSFYHHWSHQAAYEETARQTAELFGIRSGGGLYFNYVFTIVWAADTLWIWLDAAGYRKRSRWVSCTIHGFLAFMFFNATIVFAQGWVRWIGMTTTAGLGLLWLRAKHHKLSPRPPAR